MEDLMRMKEDYIHEIVRLYHEKGITKDTIEILDTLVHTAKNLCKIIEDMNGKDMYSSRGMSSYDSYSMGRGTNANRDSMGRYSSLGYSGHDDMVTGLRDLMNRTHDESTRRELQDMINRYQ